VSNAILHKGLLIKIFGALTWSQDAIKAKFFGWDNLSDPIGYLAFCALVLKFACCCDYTDDLFLGKTDISYGVYILHVLG
jgi:hypothetical protein